MDTKLLLAGASMLCLGLAAPPALAQTAAGGGTLEELVVTARKTEERAQDVPVAITAISPTRMKDLSIVNLSDASRSTPNLFITRHVGNPAAPLITIRGQAQQDIILNIDPPVGVYVDGVYLPHSYGLDAALIDIERIEVLKGPQGTLYGKNTTGGAISVVTRPVDLSGTGGFIDVTLGNYDARTFTGALNLPIIKDKLGVRFVASNGQRGAVGRDGAGHPLGDDNSQVYRGKLRWEASENVHVVLAGDYQRLWNSGSAIHLVHVNDQPSSIPKTPVNASGFNEVRAELGLANTPANLLQARNVLASYVYGAPNGPKDFQDAIGTRQQEGHFDGYGVSADIGVDLTDAVQARSISAYRQLRRLDRLENDASPFTILHPSTYSWARNISQELQLTGRSDKVNWIIGAFANIEHGREDSPTSITTPLVNPNSPGITLSRLQQSSWATYGQAGYQLTEKLRFTAGLRWTSETKKNESQNATGPLRVCTVPLAIRTSPTVCSAIFDNTWRDYSYLASVDYKTVDGVLLYAKTSRGFKGGGQNIRGAGTVESFAPFAPEVVIDYEAGVKSDLWGRRLRINAAAFHTNYKNVQRSVRILSATGTSVTLITNAARAEINGFELEVTAKPLPALTLNAAAGITDAKYKKFVDATGDRSNEPFPFPKSTYSISGVYVVPVSDGEIRLATDYNWRDKVVLGPAAVFTDSTTQRAYGLWNARIAYHIETVDVEVSAFVKNLADEQYYVAAAPFDNSFGYNIAFPGLPRTFGVEFVKRFGGG